MPYPWSDATIINRERARADKAETALSQLLYAVTSGGFGHAISHVRPEAMSDALDILKNRVGGDV